MGTGDEQRQRHEGPVGYLEVLGTDIRIPVPDDPRGEGAAVAAHPAFRTILEAARRDRAEGRTVAADELRRRLEEEEAAHHRGAPLPSGRLLLRLPRSAHQELAARARAEGVSINKLILHYVSRGLGADSAARPLE